MCNALTIVKKDPKNISSSDILESFKTERILKTLREYMIGKILFEEKMKMSPKTYVCWKLRKKLNKTLSSLGSNPLGHTNWDS